MIIKNGKLELNVLAKDGDNLLLQKANTGEYVVAYGWNEECGDWRNGDYFGCDFVSLEAAVERFRDMHEEDIELAYRIESLKEMGAVLKCMNDEDAYYNSSFCELFVDEATSEDYLEMASSNIYDDIRLMFIQLYCLHHESGLYTNDPSTVIRAHEIDRRLGLDPILNKYENN